MLAKSYSSTSLYNKVLPSSCQPCHHLLRSIPTPGNTGEAFALLPGSCTERSGWTSGSEGPPSSCHPSPVPTSTWKRTHPCHHEQRCFSNITECCGCPCHDWSASNMKRYLQCAEHEKYLSNITKYCACDEKWRKSYLIFVTKKTLFCNARSDM